MYNFLLLNSNKKVVVVFGRENFRNRASNHSVSLSSATLASSITVRNLWEFPDLSLNSQNKQISKTAFFRLCNIVKTRNILSKSDAE